MPELASGFEIGQQFGNEALIKPELVASKEVDQNPLYDNWEAWDAREIDDSQLSNLSSDLQQPDLPYIPFDAKKELQNIRKLTPEQELLPIAEKRKLQQE